MSWTVCILEMVRVHPERMKVFGSVNRSRPTSLCVGGGVGIVFFSVCSVAQSCPALWNPMACSPSGSCAHGIFQEKILEWVAILTPGDLPDPGIKPSSPVPPISCVSFTQADSLPLSHLCCCCALSCLTLCSPIDCSLPDSFDHEFSRPGYWSGLPFPSSGDLPHPGIEHASLPLHELASRYFLHCATWEALYVYFLKF